MKNKHQREKPGAASSSSDNGKPSLNGAPSKRKKSHPTSRNRNRRQKLKQRYMEVREEAQLQGIIQVSPEGAVRNERVDPLTQSTQEIPSLDRAAVVRGWAVPEEKKQLVVAKLLEPFSSEEADPYLLKENAKVLVQADQRQYERDHPEEAGKARGAVNVTQQNATVTGAASVSPLEMYKQLIAEVSKDEVEEKILQVEGEARRIVEVQDAKLEPIPERVKHVG